MYKFMKTKVLRNLQTDRMKEKKRKVKGNIHTSYFISQDF